MRCDNSFNIIFGFLILIDVVVYLPSSNRVLTRPKPNNCAFIFIKADNKLKLYIDIRHIKSMAILPPDPIYVLRGDMGPVHSLHFRISPYIEHLYAGAENGIIHIWDLKVRAA